MATRLTLRSIVRWLPLAAAVATIALGSLSAPVKRWWKVQSAPDTSSLPAAANPVLQWRADIGDADVHAVLWFVATLALVWAMRRRPWPRVMAAAVVLWVGTGVVELGQRWVSNRTSQWIDVVANGLGIAAGLVVGSLAIAVWQRTGGRAPRIHESPDTDAHLDPSSTS